MWQIEWRADFWDYLLIARVCIYMKRDPFECAWRIRERFARALRASLARTRVSWARTRRFARAHTHTYMHALARIESRISRTCIYTHSQHTASHSRTPSSQPHIYTHSLARRGEVGGWGRVPFSRNLMSPTPRRKWYLTTGRRAHSMVLDPIS